MPEFKDMLKYFRMREGLSQRELAKRIGISSSTISMYEIGAREPDFETEELLADFFNTDLDTLRGIDREMQERQGREVAKVLSDENTGRALRQFVELPPGDKEIVADMINRLYSYHVHIQDG